MKGGTLLGRIKNEFREISAMSEPNPYVSINPQINETPNGGVTLNGVITFPPDSVYYPGNFNVKIIFHPKYPNASPNIYLVTPMYHFNVTDDGGIKVNKLDRWSIGYRFYSVLAEIQNELYKFDINKNMVIVNPDIFELFNENRPEFNKIAKERTLKYASENPEH